MFNPYSLSGKTILITGASSGIGKTTAIECAKLGAQVVITGRDLTRLRETYNILEGNGHLLLQADLTNNKDIDALLIGLPQLSGLVCNAGIFNPKLYSFTSIEEAEQVFKINFFSPFDLLRRILKQKKIERNSSIVFVSSIAGNTITSLGSSVYGASKSALNGLSKALALELAPKQIRVNTVMPGMIETPILAGSSISNDELEEDRKRYPLGRYGQTQDVAYAIIYLLSNASSWVTGTNILLDGGFTLT
ncbi:MAG: SDR family oxidoreductase [Bacteroidetes bacterium]|nr:SDR family oxidoreductase [Bacteroidota bacterium]